MPIIWNLNIWFFMPFGPASSKCGTSGAEAIHFFFLCVHRLNLWIPQTNYHRAELDVDEKPKIESMVGEGLLYNNI
jgi:hypothetical protein